MPKQREYRKFRLVQARVRADREFSGMIAQTTDGKGRVPKGPGAGFLYDLRRERRRVYGSLLRYIDVAAGAGVPKEVVKRIPEVLDAYIDDCYGDSPRAA